MKYMDSIKMALASIVAILLAGRPFAGPGFLVYPIPELLTEILKFSIEDSVAILFGIAFDGLHISLGVLILTLGFRGLAKYRKVAGLTAAGFAAFSIVMGLVFFL